MRPQLNRFDTIAPIYDRLAFLVFGDSIKRAQTVFLEALPKNGNILILGGGTGWLARHVLANSAATVFYVEASAKMLEISGKRLAKFEQRVVLIHGTHKSIPPELQFDAVITNFFLDLFHPEDLERTVSRIASTLKTDAIWLAADFVDKGRWWQRLLLSAMYAFFRATGSIDSVMLPDWQGALTRNGLVPAERSFFYHRFIESVVYRRVKQT